MYRQDGSKRRLSPCNLGCKHVNTSHFLEWFGTQRVEGFIVFLKAVRNYIDKLLNLKTMKAMLYNVSGFIHVL